jgi:hypothetical protein
MRVLVACEYSATVRDAFRKRGHDAWSCDLLPTEGDPQWHIQGDALEIAYGMPWDLLIAHPPCTYLTWAGTGSWNKPGRAEKREQALSFFRDLWNSPIEKIAIENPRGYPTKVFRRQDQEVNPFDFGEPIRKRICLWLKGLPPLFPTNFVEVKPEKTYTRRDGRKYNCYYHQGKTAKERARFFPSVANAMAEQWGDLP